MPIKEIVYYAIICDHGECGLNATEDIHYDEYDSTATLAEAEQDARDAEWQQVDLGRAVRWYCPAHQVEVTQPEGVIHDPTPPPPPLFDAEEARS